MRFLILLTLLNLMTMSCQTSTDFSKGKVIYESKCQSCHLVDGSGLGTYIPNLQQPDLDYIIKICVIKNGRGEKNLVMPGFNLTEVESANLINYLNEQFGNKKVWLPADLKKSPCPLQNKQDIH